MIPGFRFHLSGSDNRKSVFETIGSVSRRAYIWKQKTFRLKTYVRRMSPTDVFLTVHSSASKFRCDAARRPQISLRAKALTHCGEILPYLKSDVAEVVFH